MIYALKNFLFPKTKPGPLQDKDIQFYREQGYLILKNVIDEATLKELEHEIRAIWGNRAHSNSPYILDFCEGPYDGQRMRLSDAPDDSRPYSHKLNDLFLESEKCRNISLHPIIVDALTKILEDTPAIINSLNFQKGSQQDDHFDTYFMPPPTRGRMAVTSVCLEDTHPDAGPVRYYPGSHLIEPFEFRHGGIHVTNTSEREEARTYINEQLEEKKLSAQTYLGKRGDVLIWHGQLYHGGTPIKNPAATRKTLVTHYWGASDIQVAQRKEHGAGAYYDRPHPALPSDYSSEITPN